METKRKADPKNFEVVFTEKTTKGMKQVVRNNKTKQFHWRTIAKNGNITGSGEPMTRLSNAINGMDCTGEIING